MAPFLIFLRTSSCEAISRPTRVWSSLSRLLTNSPYGSGKLEVMGFSPARFFPRVVEKPRSFTHSPS